MFERLKKKFMKQNVDVSFPFKLLTPTENAEDIDPYVEALDFALAEEHAAVRNIAVTGMYGAGKSSFLRTYFKAKRKNALWVSLALFLEENKVDDLQPGTPEFEHRLELSILQQIFHVRRESVARYVFILVCLIAIGGGIIGMLQPDFLVRYVADDVHRFVIAWSGRIFWISSLIAGLPTVALSYALLRWIGHLSVKGVGVSGGIGSVEIEMPEDLKKCSILNRNIKAIIDYFANSKSSIVVFEDIDRFEDVRIFTKLRELNLLLNNSRRISETKKPIRFIYALREELFKDEKERAKFFEASCISVGA